ncbi:unnamed protein product [Brassicogethes aeneus]|uniref:C2H2-type domain-containing protein n=1 Tax=Brassicogethes aeneus TaxID=1431903 RepID=A0A9P0BD52_BRAAE|nr:unnamed protein product [Brassicogethes aeneus]
MEQISTTNCQSDLDKLQNFSEWFNSVYRKSILSNIPNNKEEQIYLLLHLKKSIKLAVNELSFSNEPYKFTCKECNKIVTIESNKDFWTKFQDHEHLEVRLSKCFSSLQEINKMEKNNPSCSQDNPNPNQNALNEITKKLSNACISSKNEDIINSETNGLSSSHNNDSDDGSSSESSFKFNFPLKYEDLVETVLYPHSLMNDVRKIDNLKEFTIQKANKHRAVCLLCPCEIMSTKSISKKGIIDHVFGQRHLRSASNPTNVDALIKYHNVFLNMETSYQCHQVYFFPDMNNLKCILCNVFIKYHAAQSHIDSDTHKNKVLSLFEKGFDFNLLTNQIHGYGIKLEEIIKKVPPVNAVKSQGKRQRERADSSADKEVVHSIIKAVDNVNPDNILTLLPNRFKGHKDFLKLQQNKLQCVPCKVTITKSIDLIKQHIQSSIHLQNSKHQVVSYKYFCEICNDKFSSEVQWEKHFVGPNRHGNIGESRRSKVIEYECTTCSTVIFGDELSLTRHLSVSPKQAIKEVKLNEKLKTIFANRDCLKQYCKELTAEANEVVENTDRNNKCCRAIEDLLSVTFQDCKAHPFGSRISGLGNHDSDLDVFLDTGGMYNGDKCQDATDQVKFVKEAEKIFRKSNKIFKKIQCVPTARTPIIKLFHVATELDCDISFRHGLSVENTKFLRFCMLAQPISQTLTLILKQWSCLSGFNDNISTYALAMMVMFFLQTKKMLPSVAKIRETNKGPHAVIDGWETINYSVPFEHFHVPYNDDITDLLNEFFTYYFNFDYNILVICPLLGRTISKKYFVENEGQYLPNEMKSYKDKQKLDNAEEFRANSPICIQDPFDLSHNLTKACSFSILEKFRKYCELSVKHLSKI